MSDHRPRRRGIRQKHFTIGLSEALHPCLKLLVRGSKAFVDFHELGRQTLALTGAD
jgi:hypothetical protein